MSKSEFVHLHTHTEYSLLDGACRIPALVNRAKELGMPALAMTDHGVMYATVDFYQECRENGINPIVGCEVYVAPRSRTSRNPRLDNHQYHLVLLAKDITGYRNLLKLVSKGFLEGFYYKPRVDSELLAQYCEGLIAMSACLGGEIPEHIRSGQTDKAEQVACAYREMFGAENFYLELQEHGLPDQKAVNDALIEMSVKLNIPLVATNDIHYLNRGDSESHQVLLCIQTNSTVEQPKISFGSDEFYFKSAEEMAQVFPDHPEALANTAEIASRCNLELDFSKIHLPHFEPPDGLSADAYLEKLCRESIPKRYREVTPEIVERFEYEMKVIADKGLSGYYLIVSDFVNHAKRTGVSVGPGRGSGAGSIVAYLTGITNIDPLKYGLMFERFLTPGRITMPDFDLDFADSRREEVVQYVREKYGDDRVSQIVTFGTMGARGAVRDCGRALNIPLPEVDVVAKMVPEALNITLDEALKTSSQLQEMYSRDSSVRKLIDMAKGIEGLARHSSVHAAGILISKEPLDDHVPLQRPNEGDIRVAGFDMNNVAKIGLMKFDFLGLRTLSVLDDCIAMVEKNRGVKIDLDEIPMDDEKVYKMLQAGDASGVFQLESSGMRQLLRDLKPEKFDDLVPVVALYRPGPLGSGMVEDFVKRKRGREEVVHIHPKCAHILEDTYGVLLYQEQIMRIAMEMASFSPVDSDTLRQAMSKKKLEKIQELRGVFVERAVENGIDKKTSEKIYDLMANFGSYGFNKSHTACYAVIAYQTAYLKANFPAEFMAATLTSFMDNKTKVASYVEDSRRAGIGVLPPDINRSEANFSVEGGDIRFGLAAIKNVGRGAIETILHARDEKGPFKSLHEFCRRACDASITRATIECLIKAGSFDSINPNRAQLLFVLDEAVGSALQIRRDRINGQASLFDDEEPGGLSYLEPAKLPQVTEFSRDEKLAVEKDLLGLYVSDHPLLRHKERLRKAVTVQSNQLHEKKEKEEVVVGGIITRIRSLTTRKGDPMAFVTLNDFTGQIDVTVFPSVYKDYQKCLIEDGIVVVKGRVNNRDRKNGDEESTSNGVICESIAPLVSGSANGNGTEAPKSINIKIDRGEKERLLMLHGLLKSNSGENNVYFHVPKTNTTAKVELDIKVDLSSKLISEIEQIMGKQTVWIE